MSGHGEQSGSGGRARREARLADKLRQNLVRRKAKARAERGPASGTTASRSDARADRAPADDADECKS